MRSASNGRGGCSSFLSPDASSPARLMRALTETELAWKLEGTAGYVDLTRRSRATMRATTPLAEPEPDRRRLQLPELLPLSTLKERLL